VEGRDRKIPALRTGYVPQFLNSFRRHCLHTPCGVQRFSIGPFVAQLVVTEDKKLTYRRCRPGLTKHHQRTSCIHVAVHILTLMVALQDGVFMSQRYWGPIKIPRVCLFRVYW